MFGEVGYDAATFQEIAVRADLTRPAINHYFPSKRELYREVAEEAVNAIVESGVREARLRHGFAEQMNAFLHTTAAVEYGDPSAAAFLITSVLESQRHPELAEDGPDVMAVTRDFVAWALAEAQAGGELRDDVDLDAATEVLLSMLIGIGFYAGFCARPEDGERRFTTITEQFLRMLRGEGLVRSG